MKTLDDSLEAIEAPSFKDNRSLPEISVLPFYGVKAGLSPGHVGPCNL